MSSTLPLSHCAPHLKLSSWLHILIISSLNCQLSLDELKIIREAHVINLIQYFEAEFLWQMIFLSLSSSVTKPLLRYQCGPLSVNLLYTETPKLVLLQTV